ncbi:MAG: transposase [Thermodesulfovibrionales bacterium]
MEIPVNLDDYFCPNESCGNHKKKGHGNIVIYDRYGRNRRRLLKCKTCNSTFSERRSSVFFGLHTKESKIKEVIHNLLEGMSLREAADASGLDKDTVHRIWKRFVNSCEESVESLLKEFNIKLEDLILILYKRTKKK